MNYQDFTIGLICPTYNAGDLWKDWIKAYYSQSIKVKYVLIIDSESSDSTTDLSSKSNFRVIGINKKSFNHGGTRNFAVQSLPNEIDIVVFLTQDAILSDVNSLERLLEPFKNSDIAAVCGRQIPHKNADSIARHSRAYNYSGTSRINTYSDIQKLGLKAAYMSNSFAAYRLSAFRECDGFPEELIFGEDMYLAAKMILKGYKTFYCADASVFHSHNYRLKEEFRRYFDIGVFHSSQPFLLESFGKPSGEGLKFAISELKYCLKNGGLIWGLNSIVRTGLKFIGYKLGILHNKLPAKIAKTLSMDKNYWIK